MEQERYKPDVIRRYQGAGIVVHWEPGLCIHVSKSAFAPCRTSSIRMRGLGLSSTPLPPMTSRLLSATCPSGALSYERTDGTPAEAPDVPTTVQPQLNGPLYLRGDIEVIDRESNVIRKANRVALCRCGHSTNNPFCDLSHRGFGFQAE